MSLLRYGDYVARVGYDAEIDTFFGEGINTAGVITFYGPSIEELRREMGTSIEACRAAGVEPARPYSGRFQLRLDPAEHARVAAAAAAAGKSINGWIAETLARAAERELGGA